MRPFRILLGCMLIALCSLSGGARAQVITEFDVGIRAGAGPFGITAGPDGNLWFTEANVYTNIGRITPLGVVTEFGAGITAGANLYAITLGPDGNLWFTEQDGRIGRITPLGVVTEFSAGISPGANPRYITAGPDGNLWFTETYGNRIGRITPSGVVTEFSAGITPGAFLEGITAGPDGNLWFTEFAGNRIGRITPTGVVTEFSAGITAGAGPTGITAGPDGNLWFTEQFGGRIGRITPSGVVTEFVVGIPGPGGPFSITVGPDGNLWFTETAAIGRITPTGVVTKFSAGLRNGAHPLGITAGPDGNLWFAEFSDAIGRITTGSGLAPGAIFVTSASNAAPTGITSLALVCPASGIVVVTGSGESAAKSNFAGNAFIGLAYSIARDSNTTDIGSVVQSSALAAFNGDANRDFLNVQRFDTCTPGQPHTYTLTAYATTPQTSIASGSFTFNGRLIASEGLASSSFAAGITYVNSASNATPTVIATLPAICPASGMLAVTGSGESAAKSNFAGNAFIGVAYSISRNNTATDNGNVVQSSALAVFNGDANRDFLNVQRVDSCTPGASSTYYLTAYATSPQTNIMNASFVFNGRLTATMLPVATGFAPGTSLIGSASNAVPNVITSVNVTCPASGKAIVVASGESAAKSNFAGNAFIGLAYSIARDSSATDNANVVQSSALAAFNGDANRDFLHVQRADTCTPGALHTYSLTAYATTPQTSIVSGSFVWNGRLVAILPP